MKIDNILRLFSKYQAKNSQIIKFNTILNFIIFDPRYERLLQVLNVKHVTDYSFPCDTIIKINSVICIYDHQINYKRIFLRF